MKKEIRFITQGAVIAAIYAVLTLIFAFSSFAPSQVRISEALTILPAFTPAAIPGLFIGCLIANIIGSGNIFDIIFGSLATLLAAYLSYKMPRRWLVPLPPVVVNAVVVGIVLNRLFDVPLWLTMGQIGLGQLVACYGLGYLLMLRLDKYKNKLFK